MSEAKPNPVIRLLPSLTDVAFLMPIVFLFLRMEGARSLLGDGDTGWHIRTGEWILANGRVPDRDIFSFTKAGEPWFAWEWLWDVLFAWLHQHGGLAAVVLASLLVICVTFTLLFRLIHRKCSNVLIAIAITLLAMMASTIHWLARPHLFTWLFVVIFYSILERARDGNTRLLWLLPVLTVLWTNLHGGFFVGIILLGAYAGGEILRWLFEARSEDRSFALSRSKQYLIVAATCALATFASPYTYRLPLHIYRYLTESYHFRNISEFLSISFQNPAAIYFEVMIVLGIAAAFWNLGRKRFVYCLLVAGWLHLALISARNIPIFAIVAAPIVAEAMQQWLLALQKANVAGWARRAVGALQDLAADFGQTDRMTRWHLVSGMAVLLVMGVFYAPGAPLKFRAEYDPKNYPDKAIEVLQSLEFANSNIFTNDEWGDYLIYRLYPTIKVFIDGRSDFYGAEFGEQYLGVLKVKYDWEETLSGYGVNTILLQADASLAGTLKESKRWRIVYDDGVAIVFRPSAPVRLAESDQSSAVACDGRTHRDRKITKFNNRDPRITKSNTRSEPL